MVKVGAAASLVLLLSVRAHAQECEPNLWIVDDKTNTVYEVTLEGDRLSDFERVSGGDSSIAVDPETHTLWSAADSAARNLAVNFARDGALPPACTSCESVIKGLDIDAVGLEGVDVDLSDDSLWLVDDPSTGGLDPFLFNVTKDGTPIDAFPTTTFSVDARSPQGIAYDPFEDSLWLTDNSADTIYNVTKTGTLVRSISVVDYTDILDPGENPNPQGISVDLRNGSLWVTDRATDKIYNITAGRGNELGGQLISFFDASTNDPLSTDVTGVAFDGPFIAIDIRPGDDSNKINLRSRGVIPVALLGSPSFDVGTVNPSTLTFGPGDAALKRRKGGHFEDVNDDGFLDLVAHFRTQNSGIGSGDDEACITGETMAGCNFDVCDAIATKF